MLYSSLELFFCIALTVYITTSVTVAVVRWGHRCEPYAQHMDSTSSWCLSSSCPVTYTGTLPWSLV